MSTNAEYEFNSEKNTKLKQAAILILIIINTKFCHSSEGGKLFKNSAQCYIDRWFPAFAGMTIFILMINKTIIRIAGLIRYY